MVALTAALLAGAAVAGGVVRNVLAPASESAPAPRPVAVVASTFELNDQARRLWSASLGKKPSSHDFSRLAKDGGKRRRKGGERDDCCALDRHGVVIGWNGARLEVLRSGPLTEGCAARAALRQRR